MTADEERFTAVYDACRQRVWAYAAARAGRQIADEVVSETFAIAWRRVREMPDPPLPWLLGVARNVLRDGHRTEARREAFARELAHWAPPPAADVAEHVAERLAVLRALAALSEDDREVLILTAWQGLAPREASKVLGCSTAAFRVRLHRARRRLQQAVEQDAPKRTPSRTTATGRGTTATDPGASTADAGVSATGPGTTATEPRTTATEPGITAAGPGLTGTGPGLPGTEAEVTGTAAGITAAEAGIAGTGRGQSAKRVGHAA
ncbi:RNA polymerase sigma factor [Actinomadura rupiterrae]|uniref:RNA polymerase sigma factor n=1 Tax=Actinomadura rupiterrae TaxID=559627 RepID=UPI0020A3DD92|nr:RNA polymerase sigma factor [Actinomadura rupiterrae]MCP2337732.1 RNA polymerase sigma-70 factor (ECF subfamily) [Actinomadura rupiterrae]